MENEDDGDRNAAQTIDISSVLAVLLHLRIGNSAISRWRHRGLSFAAQLAWLSVSKSSPADQLAGLHLTAKQKQIRQAVQWLRFAVMACDSAM